MKRRKIGIMGGTFNPIHNAHVALAQAAYEHCALDEVWFMPSGVSYLKKDDKIVSGEQRLEMTRLAIEGIPHFDCSDIEVRRKGNTYTADTLCQLHEMYPEDEFCFIMGADSLFGLIHWKSPEVIARLATLVAVVRDDIDVQELEKQKCFLEQTLGACVVLIPFHKTNISSGDIRNKLANGQKVNGLLPEKVLDYIKEHGLYTED